MLKVQSKNIIYNKDIYSSTSKYLSLKNVRLYHSGDSEEKILSKN